MLYEVVSSGSPFGSSGMKAWKKIPKGEQDQRGIAAWEKERKAKANSREKWREGVRKGEMNK